LSELIAQDSHKEEYKRVVSRGKFTIHMKNLGIHAGVFSRSFSTQCGLDTRGFQNEFLVKLPLCINIEGFTSQSNAIKCEKIFLMFMVYFFTLFS